MRLPYLFLPVFALQSTLKREDDPNKFSGSWTSGNNIKDGCTSQKPKQSIVEHDYHDHAKDPIEQPTSPSPVTNVFQQSPPDIRPSTPFPQKLFFMLLKLEDEGLTHIASWQPHGRCFLVHKPDDFKEHLPRFFKLSKIASFQRQLNLYGFTRLSKGMDKGAYYNEYFLRGRSDLLSKIPRIRVKGTRVRAKSNPDQEPDFWKMEWVNSHSSSHDRVASHERDSDHTFSTNSNSCTMVTNSSSARTSTPSVIDESLDSTTEPLPVYSSMPSHLSFRSAQSLLSLIGNTTAESLQAACSTSSTSTDEADVWGMKFHWSETCQSEDGGDMEFKSQAPSTQGDFLDVDEIVLELKDDDNFLNALDILVSLS